MVHYCGFCDGRLQARRLNIRPVFRSTHARRCEQGHTSPACERCSRHTLCPVCGSSVALSMLLHAKQGDSDDDDKKMSDQVDVRKYPPRFCPAARVLSRVPYIYGRRQKIAGWYLPVTSDCTGCSAPGPLFRVLFDVVMIYGGNPQSTSSSSSSAAPVVADVKPIGAERYRHKL